MLLSLLLVLLLLLASLLELAILNRFQAASALGETTIQRIEELKQASEAFWGNPWLGDGAGRTFLVNSPVTGYLEYQRYIHNLPAYLLATGGVVGAVAYLCMLFPLFFGVRGSPRLIDAGAVKLAIVAALLYCVVSATFKSIHLNVFLGILLACIDPSSTGQPQHQSRFLDSH